MNEMLKYLLTLEAGGTVDPDEIATRAIPSGEVVLDSATSIKSEAFCRCDNMTKISSETVTTIKARAFEFCRNLEEVSFPNVTSIGAKDGSYGITGFVFCGCPKLHKFFFPKLTTTIGSRCFGSDDGSGGVGVGSSSFPATIVLPSASSLSAQTFRGSDFWDAIDLGSNFTKIEGYQFYQGVYKNIILRSPTLVTLVATSGMGVGTGGGPSAATTVFVPQALLTEYAAATNWASAKSSKGFSFAAIEGSIYETQYADGTPITT